VARPVVNPAVKAVWVALAVLAQLPAKANQARVVVLAPPLAASPAVLWETISVPVVLEALVVLAESMREASSLLVVLQSRQPAACFSFAPPASSQLG
jgi:hypothetical protein